MQHAQQDLALVDQVLASYLNDATIALCVRLIAPRHCVEPIADKAAEALKSDGADGGLVGLRRNLLNWLTIPAIAVLDGYREAPSRYRHPGKWWSTKGRHTVRMMVSRRCAGWSLVQQTALEINEPFDLLRAA